MYANQPNSPTGHGGKQVVYIDKGEVYPSKGCHPEDTDTEDGHSTDEEERLCGRRDREWRPRPKTPPPPPGGGDPPVPPPGGPPGDGGHPPPPVPPPTGPAGGTPTPTPPGGAAGGPDGADAARGGTDGADGENANDGDDEEEEEEEEETIPVKKNYFNQLLKSVTRNAESLKRLAKEHDIPVPAKKKVLLPTAHKGDKVGRFKFWSLAHKLVRYPLLRSNPVVYTPVWGRPTSHYRSLNANDVLMDRPQSILDCLHSNMIVSMILWFRRTFRRTFNRVHVVTSNVIEMDR